MSQSLPLSQLRVLDLSSALPGSVVSLLLAEYGAEVIKIERPGGDPSRLTGANRSWDRGKRSIVLDLNEAADRAVAAELASGADVLLDGLGPGRADGLGLGYDVLRKANPGLVHCSILGYDPRTRWRDRPGIDALVAARLGVMADQPGYRDGPIFVGHPAIGYGTALLTTISVLAAVRVRHLTGQGQHLHSSMHDGILAQTTMHWASERGFASFVRARTGRPDFGRRRLILGAFECSDGKLIHVHSGAVGAFGRAIKVFGLSDRISTGGGAVEMSSEMSEEEAQHLNAALPRIIRTRPSQEWLELLWRSEVAALPLQPPGEAFDDDQVRHNGLIESVDDPDLGTVDMVGPPVTMSLTPGVRGRRAPRLDEHGAEIRQSGWASSRLPVATATASLRHPLEGVKIVEFSTFFAASYAGRLLANLGAEIVKVETVAGDPMRPLYDMFEGAQAGKRSIAVDLKSPEGAEVARLLIGRADIVHHNLRPGAAERLGIDDASVRAYNHEAVYCYSPGFGASGPKSRLQSFAPLQSGFAGLFHEACGEGNMPLAQFGNEDYYNGLLAGCGIMLALLHRDRTGRGQQVQSPQVHSTVFATSHVVRKDGHTIRAIPLLDRGQTGYGPLYRLYPCSEGWICVACITEAHAAALLGAVGGAELAGDPRFAMPAARGEHAVELAEILTAAFAGAPAADWSQRLDAAGAPAEVAADRSRRDELFTDPEVVAAQLTVERDHPVHGRVHTAGLMFHLEGTPGLITERAPLLGEHTREILAELGMGDRADDWIANGIARVVTPADVAAARKG